MTKNHHYQANNQLLVGNLVGPSTHTNFTITTTKKHIVPPKSPTGYYLLNRDATWDDVQ